MSTRPCARVLMTPMTLPRSFRLLAPAASMHSVINASSSPSLELLRKIALEYEYLGFFFGDQIFPAAVAILTRRVAALLDHALEDCLNSRIIERPASVDLALLDRCEGHSQNERRALSPAFSAACMSCWRRSLSAMTGNCGSVETSTPCGRARAAFHVPFHGRRLLALPFLSRLLVELAATQLCQNTGLFAGPLEAAQRGIEVFAFSDSDARHQMLVMAIVKKKRPARPALSREY